MALEFHRLSREYVWWQVNTSNDIAGATVEVAFTDAAALPAAWETATLVIEEEQPFIRVLLSGEGQGGDIMLAPGDYQAWVRITDNPERPVRKTGIVTVL